MSTLIAHLSAIGTAQGLFVLSALLARPVPNVAAARLCAGFIGVATLMLVLGAWVGASALPPHHPVIYLNINTELGLAPLLYLFARSLTGGRLGRRDAAHGLPLLIGVFAWMVAWFALSTAEARQTFLADTVAVPVYMGVKFTLNMVYLAAAHRVLRRSAGHSLGLTWLRHAVLVCVALIVTIYAANVADRAGASLPIEPDPMSNVILAGLIYVSTLLVLDRPGVFTRPVRPERRAARWAGDARTVTDYLEREKPWRNPSLGLGDLATALGWSDARLSSVIREGLGSSFYPLIARYRLAEFERRAHDPAERGSTVLELAFAAGFNSKAAFYRTFREAHGTTPTAFRSRSLEKASH